MKGCCFRGEKSLLYEQINPANEYLTVFIRNLVIPAHYPILKEKKEQSIFNFRCCLSENLIVVTINFSFNQNRFVLLAEAQTIIQILDIALATNFFLHARMV